MRIRLRYKVFGAILLANTLLTGVIVYANNRAFTASFESYLSHVQARRLTPLLNTLAEEYEARGDWQWLVADPDAWRTLTQRYLWPRHPRRLEAQGSRQRREMTIQLRGMEDDQLIAGTPRERGRTAWLPIEVAGEQVGALGVPVNLRLTAEFDQVFAEQQRRQLRWIALAALMLAAAIAVPFANLLVRPIGRLQAAIHQLATGRFGVNLSLKGSDELSELAGDVNALATTLQQNLAARQRWIADISHELRTPVATLQAELEALQDGVTKPDPSTLASLHQEILRLGRLIADLHELSLSDAGALSYCKAEVDVGQVIQEVYARYKGTLAQRHLVLEYQAPPTPVILQGDRDRLVQLFTNLLQNSMNYTDGSSDQPGRVRILLIENKRKIHISWSDSAPGVPPEAHARLFDRLYRVEDSRSRATGGSGLGLSIVRNIVEAHGGRITPRPSDLGGLTLELEFSSTGERL